MEAWLGEPAQVHDGDTSGQETDALERGQRGHLSEMFYFVLKTQSKELMKHYQQFDKT